MAAAITWPGLARTGRVLEAHFFQCGSSHSTSGIRMAIYPGQIARTERIPLALVFGEPVIARGWGLGLWQECNITGARFATGRPSRESVISRGRAEFVWLGNFLRKPSLHRRDLNRSAPRKKTILDLSTVSPATPCPRCRPVPGSICSTAYTASWACPRLPGLTQGSRKCLFSGTSHHSACRKKRSITKTSMWG